VKYLGVPRVPLEQMRIFCEEWIPTEPCSKCSTHARCVLDRKIAVPVVKQRGRDIQVTVIGRIWCWRCTGALLALCWRFTDALLNLRARSTAQDLIGVRHMQIYVNKKIHKHELSCTHKKHRDIVNWYKVFSDSLHHQWDGSFGHVKCISCSGVHGTWMSLRRLRLNVRTNYSWHLTPVVLHHPPNLTCLEPGHRDLEWWVVMRYREGLVEWDNHEWNKVE